jgi:hypothetical protein
MDIVFGQGQFGLTGALICGLGVLLLLGFAAVNAGGIFRVLMSPAVLGDLARGRPGPAFKAAPGIIMLLLMMFIGSLFFIFAMIPAGFVFLVVALLADIEIALLAGAFAFGFIYLQHSRHLLVTEVSLFLLMTVQGLAMLLVGFMVFGYLFGDAVGMLSGLWLFEVATARFRIRRGTQINIGTMGRGDPTDFPGYDKGPTIITGDFSLKPNDKPKDEPDTSPDEDKQAQLPDSAADAETESDETERMG